MELKNTEVRDGIKWLLRAGTAAIGLSLFLFWADNSVMGNAKNRNIKETEQLRELRVAQSSLPARVTDSRQTLPLSIEDEGNQGGK